MNPSSTRRNISKGSARPIKSISVKRSDRTHGRAPCGRIGECPCWEARAATIEDVAQYLRIKKSAARRLASLGKLPGACIGKDWRFDLKTVRDKTTASGQVLRLKLQPKVKDE